MKDLLTTTVAEMCEDDGEQMCKAECVCCCRQAVAAVGRLVGGCVPAYVRACVCECVRDAEPASLGALEYMCVSQWDPQALA